jgi:hypothetical protein
MISLAILFHIIIYSSFSRVLCVLPNTKGCSSGAAGRRASERTNGKINERRGSGGGGSEFL